jgi:hypothetical protein
VESREIAPGTCTTLSSWIPAEPGHHHTQWLAPLTEVLRRHAAEPEKWPRVFVTIVPQANQFAGAAEYAAHSTFKQKWGYGGLAERFINLAKELLTTLEGKDEPGACAATGGWYGFCKMNALAILTSVDGLKRFLDRQEVLL